MVKILFLISTLKCGGAEMVLTETVKALPKDKFEITVQTIFASGEFSNKLDSNIIYKSICNFKSKLINRIIGKLIRCVLPARLSYNLFIKDEYDIEIAFLEGCPTRLIANSSNIHSKKLAWVHTDLSLGDGSANDFKSFDERKQCYKKFDKIACVSETVKKTFIGKFGDDFNNIYTIYNVIDDEYVRKMSDEKFCYDKENIPLIVSCGRLAKQKGYDRLIRIHSRLIREGLIHNLWIVGGGEEENSLKELINECKAEKTVTLWGYRKNPYKIFSKGDLFVCSSRNEGFSTVVTEAVILGLPVISCNISGAMEPAACPRCNVIVDNDEEALYSGLKKILENWSIIEEYKLEQIKKSEYFTKERFLNSFIEFIEN